MFNLEPAKEFYLMQLRPRFRKYSKNIAKIFCCRDSQDAINSINILEIIHISSVIKEM